MGVAVSSPPQRLCTPGTGASPMRAFPIALVAFSLIVFLPSPAAADPGPVVECDMDDDLYNHCHAGPFYWVTGPGCVGVNYGAPAECEPGVDRT